MEPLSPLVYSVPRYFLGKANIDQKVVDAAIHSLEKEMSIYYSSHIENKSKFVYQHRGTFLIPSYLSEMEIDRDNRFYADRLYKIKTLDPLNSFENLLISLSQRISSLGFPSDRIEVRFEKGCFYSLANFWHKDFAMHEEHNFFSICYSNVENWSTKILDVTAVKAIGKIPFVIEKETLEKIESLATNSELGVFYDVKQVYHRAPVSTDFDSHVSNHHYRLFIRFNNTYRT
ncbi:MAG: hypothetical protein H0U49_02350 [Parachlamydiaceae bacterium]|nr:hypothetical protein [Parachlamydiaceae bacterium]